MKNRQELLDFLASKGITRETMGPYVDQYDKIMATMPELPTPILVADALANKKECEARINALALIVPLVMLEASRYCSVEGSQLDVEIAENTFGQIGEVGVGILTGVKRALRKAEAIKAGEDPDEQDAEDKLRESLDELLEALGGPGGGDVRVVALKLGGRSRRARDAARGASGRPEAATGAAPATPSPGGTAETDGGPPGGPYATSEEAFAAGTRHGEQFKTAEAGQSNN